MQSTGTTEPIQSRHRIFFVKFFLSLVLFGTTLPIFGQSNSTISLSPKKITTPSRPTFFVLDVMDKRAVKTKLGTIIEFGVPKSLQFDNRLERALYTYWSTSTPGRTGEPVPLEITIKKWEISEKKVAPNKISGEFEVEIVFGWTRNLVPIELTTYTAKTSYTRSETKYSHAALMEKMADNAFLFIDKWIKENTGKTPKLVNKLTLVVRERTPKDSEDSVYYRPTRPLTWEDFRGTSANPTSRFAAAVFTSWSYEGIASVKGRELEVVVNLNVFMVKSMSWSKPEARNEYTLRHEQLHFDVTRMVAHRYKTKLESLSLSIEDYDSQLQYEFIESFREMNQVQKKYDAETQHGTARGEQARWDKEISAEMSRINASLVD
jgi:hypothetical protein